MGSLMVRGIEVELITRRLDPGNEMRLRLWEKQNGKCECCGDELKEGRYEVAHIIARASSIGDEGNAEHNLCLTCKPCHNEENHAQDLSNPWYGHTLASHPSPVLQDLFEKEGKPRQQVFGSGATSGKPVYEIDARGSRSNGIWEYGYGIPIFSPVDDPERCLDDNGLWRHEPTYWHDIWVSCSDYDLEDAEEADECMPYDGEHLYPIGR